MVHLEHEGSGGGGDGHPAQGRDGLTGEGRGWLVVSFVSLSVSSPYGFVQLPYCRKMIEEVTSSSLLPELLYFSNDLCSGLQNGLKRICQVSNILQLKTHLKITLAGFDGKG